MNYLYLLINILMLVAGQIFFKIGIEKMGGVSIIDSWKALFNPYVLIGLALYGITTLLWFVILTKMPLSVAYPIQSLAYVFGIIFAILIFKESVSYTKWIGVGVIIVGVILISLENE